MYTSAVKPMADKVGALLIILVTSWLIAVIYLVYLLKSERPVLFRQLRVGKNDKAFAMFKFRTLKPDQEKPLAERTFLWGTFLRKYNLDELPQLWNVLKGDMSFVGPRPLPVAYLSLMSEGQRKRHRVKPGITGWAQINGRHSISWQQKFDFDLYYVGHCSLGLDSLIIFKTILLLLSFRNDRSLNEVPFTGND